MSIFSAYYEINTCFAPMLSLFACIVLFIVVTAVVASVVAVWEQAFALTLYPALIHIFPDAII